MVDLYKDSNDIEFTIENFYIKFGDKKMVPDDPDELGFFLHTPNSNIGISLSYIQFVIYLEQILIDERSRMSENNY